MSASIPSQPLSSPADSLAERTAAALWARLQLVRSRWRGITALEAVLLGLVAGSAVLGCGLALATLVGQARGALALVLWVAAMPAVATTTAMLLHRHLLQRRLARWAAVRAMRHATVDGELLRSGVELAAQVRSHGTGSVGSAWMVAAMLAQADQQVSGLDADIVALQRRCKRYLAWLLAVACAALLVRAHAEPTWQAWFSSNQPEAVQPRDVGTLVGDVHLRIQPPDYAATAVPLREEEGAETQALRGSKVTVQAAPLPDVQVDAVEIQQVVQGRSRSERQPVASLDDRGWVWQATLLQGLRYRFIGRDKLGNPLREATFRELKPTADQPPKVVLSQPSGEVEVRAGQTLVLLGQVDDDIGLSQIELAVARPTGGLERRPVALVVGELHKDVRESLAVDSLQLRPGEVAQLQLEAADANPFDGARKGMSDKLRVRMFSADRHHGKVLELLRQLADQWALRLADRLERDPAVQRIELAAALKARMEMVEGEEKAMAALRGLRRSLGDDAQAKARSLADLDAIERQLAEALGDEQRALQRTSPTPVAQDGDELGASRELYAVQRHHALVVAAQEQAVAALADLAGDELDAMLAKDAKALVQSSQQLMAALEKLADKDAKPLQAEAERLLDVVEQQLERLAATAQDQARLVPFEHLNARALQAIGLQRDLGDQRAALGEIRRLLKDGKAREAMQRLRQLTDQLAASVGQRGKAARTSEDEALDALVQDLRRGIGRAQDAQGRLRDDVRAPAEEQAHAGEEHVRKMRDTALPQVADLLREARELLRPARLGSSAARKKSGLGEARQALDAADDALEHGRLDSVLQRIQEAQDGVGAMRRALTQEDDLAEMAKAAADGRRLQAADDRLSRAAQKLREALPEPQELLRPTTQSRMDALADGQGRVRLAMERMRRRLAEAGDAHPALQRQVGERLDHALQTMREAEDSMRRSDARRALNQTAEALDALDRANELLRQDGQGQPGSQQQSDDVGMDAGDAPVELRSNGAGADSERYRQELLRAMQQRAPQAWKERLDGYWKAIGR